MEQLILAIMGIIITSYISISHILKRNVICPINKESCNTVLDSKYSKILGIKNEFIGLMYYIFIILTVFLPYLNNFIILIKIISGLAALYSIILFTIQVKIIKNYCFWCIFTAIINILLFISLMIK